MREGGEGGGRHGSPRPPGRQCGVNATDRFAMYQYANLHDFRIAIPFFGTKPLLNPIKPPQTLNEYVFIRPLPGAWIAELLGVITLGVQDR